ncbi:hypothetical protein BJ138DRAFT_1116457 [Hygrophoropsis aurantiaca]|uniref:Uncharacterized protein n=1 Tax=Hygrophoropsis aurantiaca TaxID=72124 RepID=A0ACB8A324_9AGAM|nr:hypothetical protein BJ138DRAFT_1116457 [Hygrophoropsis aurantiaca]
MRFIDLPADPLLAIFLDLDVEDVLALQQLCRALHEIGSLDYLWHKLVRTCNLPLDIPLGADSATLSGQELQAIVVKALKLDHNWRKPDARIRRAIPIMCSDRSSVNSMHLLPGGKWLITTQCAGSYDAPHTDLILWCLDDITSPVNVKTVPIDGYARSCQAYYQPAQHKFTVAVTLEQSERPEWIKVYHISLGSPAVVTHSESLGIRPVASDGAVYVVDDLRICGDTLGVIYRYISRQDMNFIDTIYLYLRNLVTGAAATITACEGRCCIHLFELFRDQYALACRHDLPAQVSIYDIPSSIISANLESPVNFGPDHILEGTLSTRCHLPHGRSFSYEASSGSLERGIPILSTMSFSWASPEVIMNRFSPPGHETRFIGLPTFASQAFLHRPAIGDHRQLGATGRRAVWVDSDELILRKWSASRHCRGETLSAGATVLTPPTSGLPFEQREIYRIAFDEATCRLCISLRTGELYVCDVL